MAEPHDTDRPSDLNEPQPIIWQRPERGARGPVPAYSRERIAEVAIALADGEGIEAVTMRRIAKELGTGAMTLYRYLPTKEDLYAVVIDQALGYEPQEPTGDVRADLATFARRYRETLRRHPGWRTPSPAGPSWDPTCCAATSATSRWSTAGGWASTR